MYIRQVQILVQAQICTWFIVYTKSRRNAVNSTFLLLFKHCRRPESNRYGYHYPRDFKSRASASSATAARDAQTVFAKSIRALHCLFNLASMGGGGFEPPKQIAADLQSVPFGHSGIHPFCLSTISIYIINEEKAQGNLSNSPALFPNFYTQNDHAAFI